MAEKSEPHAIVLPTPEAVLQPGVWTNEARLVVTPDTLTLYFFQVPPDLGDVPKMKEAVDAMSRGNRKAPVELRLQPTSKLLLDREFGKRLLALLQRQLGQD